MIGYHWSLETNFDSIKKHGLLVPTKHPKLTTPLVCSEGHRNPHISLGKTPAQAWELSGGFLVRRAKEQKVDPYEMYMGSQCLYWDLWQVDLREIRYYSNGYELQVRTDIPRRRLTFVANRYMLDP